MLHAAIAACVICGLPTPTTALAADKDAGLSEYAVKAALLIKITSFVTWPAERAGKPATKDGDAESTAQIEHICVGIIGADPFGQVLDDLLLRARTDRREFEARRAADLSTAAPCQIWFMSASQKDHLAEIVAAASAAKVLTVSDTPGFARAGGMIELAIEESKVTLIVNRDALQDAGLTVSSKLLGLAKVVDREHG